MAGLEQQQGIQSLFYLAQIVVGTVLVLGLFWGRKRSGESGFKLREADRLKDHVFSRFPAPAAAEKQQGARKPKAAPLRLPGISLDQAPHQLLGVPENAPPAQIQKAWRDLMKRYHPDKVGRPGSREWTDAQRIAEAINQAKEEMLRSRRGA